MLTPLEDIDILYLLPYLDRYDISHILQLKKYLPFEYQQALQHLKSQTFCDLSFHTCRVLDQIKQINFVDNKHSYIKPIQSVELRKDSNDITYLKIIYPDMMHKHIIYNCKIRFENDILFFYYDM